ncbi:MAG TPA: PD-(D/E)XK nuclease family protein, partial [Rhodothermia bacterium]
EIAALTQMLEAAADPGDPIALAGYLRGPLVGLSDPELLALKNSGARFNYTWGVPDGLEPNLATKAGGAFDRLDRAAKLFRERTPSAAMESLNDDLGTIPWFAAASNDAGSSRAGALIRLLANVRRWERQGTHWFEILGEMRALIDDNEYQIAGMTLEAGEPDAVRVMNLHQAKGLQARVVFLADPFDSTYGKMTPEFHVHRFGEERYLSMTVSDRPEGGHSYKTIAEPVGWDEDEEEERQFLDAEETRLRYVAATRAENLLVISTSEKSQGAWAELDPFLPEVDELPEFDDPPSPRPEPHATVLTPDKAAREARLSLIRNASWTLATVSAAEEEEFLPLTGERRGADYGTLVHDVLDLAIREGLAGDDAVLDRYVHANVPAEFAGPLKDALSGFLGSSLYREVRSSAFVFTEAPFGARSGFDGSTVVRGRIDLIYRIDGGWKLIDFKTDAAATQEEVLRVVDRYRDQVATYGRYWSQITGERVAEQGLWLTHLNQYVPID